MKATNQSQVKKIFCAYHPQQFLTNFCIQADCLMPLCPNCVIQHTEQHFCQKNKPTYLNINEAINQTKQKCYHTIILFEQQIKHISSIKNYIDNFKSIVHSKVEESKEAVFRLMDKLFQAYEQKIVKDTLEKYNEAASYEKGEAETISEYIHQQIDLLYEKIACLKGDGCLAALITYYASEEILFQNGINDIDSYLQKNNQQGKVDLHINEETMNHILLQFCEKVVQVEHVSEDKQAQNAINNSEHINSRVTLQTRLTKSKRMEKENLSANQINYKNIIKKTQQAYRAAAIEGMQKISITDHLQKTSINDNYGKVSTDNLRRQNFIQNTQRISEGKMHSPYKPFQRTQLKYQYNQQYNQPYQKEY